MRSFLAALSLAVAAAAGAAPALAQETLTGTYVTYVHIGLNGVMNEGGESMQYTANGTDLTCDLFSPGTPVEGFTIEGTGAGGRFLGTNDAGGGEDVVTTAGPTLSGRAITWAGTFTSGADSVAVTQEHRYEIADHVVRVTVRITNTGAAAITNLYYLRNGDPDHGYCGISDGVFGTENDVVRQPPADDSALLTAGAGDNVSAGRYIVLGIGAHDPRARVHVGGFDNTDASGEWTAPADTGGAFEDVGTDIIFREPMLAPAATTTFEFFYVWGESQMEVTTRFDELGFPTAPCVGLMEGAACTTAGGAMGICHATRCCTGCWDGAGCFAGTTGTACGVRGGACRSCTDGVACTLDVCTAGACSNPDAPVGSACEDGMFCTRGDTCAAGRVCTAGTAARCDDGAPCSMDTCDETTDTCTNDVTTGCLIDGTCVPAGDGDFGNPCNVCDPASSETEWSAAPIDTPCSDATCTAGMRTPPGACDASGACAIPPAARCPTGACADSMTCELPCGGMMCPPGTFCSAMGRCDPLRDLAEPCSMDGACASGFCADGVCCNGRCDGTCQNCRFLGMVGTCSPAPSGTDPESECMDACDGMGGCIGETVDAGPRDAGMRPDAGPRADSGMAGGDGGGADAGSTGGGDDGGCGCEVPGHARSDAPIGLLLLAIVALVAARRSRRR